MLVLTSPSNNQPFQRNQQNYAKVTFVGISNETLSIVATPIKSGKATLLDHIQPDSANNFKSTLTLQAGDYNIVVSNSKDIITLTLNVGDIFAIMGHSFTEANGFGYVQDERVICPDSFFSPMVDSTLYQNCGFVPMKSLSLETAKNYENADSVNFSKTRGIWGKLGDMLVERYNCPVCFYNGGFGGTTIEQWALSAENKSFQHSFADWSKRMPIVKFMNILKYIVPRTGLRGVISIHGDNDIAQKPSANQVADWYKTIIEVCRKESGFNNLHFVLSPSAYTSEFAQNVIDGTLKATQENKNVMLGAEIYKYPVEYRMSANDFHLSPTGDTKAAQDFASILGTESYLLNTIPVVVGEDEQVINVTSNIAPTIQNTLTFKYSKYVFAGLVFLAFTIAVWLIKAFSTSKP